MAVLSSRQSGQRSLDVPLSLSTRRATSLLAVASAAALCAAGLLSPTEVTSGPVVCPFRLLTGLPCPGCGMTRAWVFVMHGRIGDALSANPFVLVTMPAAVALVVAVLVVWVRRRPLPDVGRALRHPLAVLLLLAWVVFGAIRLVAVLTGHATL